MSYECRIMNEKQGKFRIHPSTMLRQAQHDIAPEIIGAGTMTKEFKDFAYSIQTLHGRKPLQLMPCK